LPADLFVLPAPYPACFMLDYRVEERASLTYYSYLTPKIYSLSITNNYFFIFLVIVVAADYQNSITGKR
jgi:hypothetical protein